MKRILLLKMHKKKYIGIDKPNNQKTVNDEKINL